MTKANARQNATLSPQRGRKKGVDERAITEGGVLAFSAKTLTVVVAKSEEREGGTERK